MVLIIFNAYVRVCSVAYVPNVCMFVEARARPSLAVILRNRICLLGISLVWSTPVGLDSVSSGILPSSGIDIPAATPGYMVLGIELRFSCMQGKHSTN